MLRTTYGICVVENLTRKAKNIFIFYFTNNKNTICGVIFTMIFLTDITAADKRVAMLLALLGFLFILCALRCPPSHLLRQTTSTMCVRAGG